MMKRQLLRGKTGWVPGKNVCEAPNVFGNLQETGIPTWQIAEIAAIASFSSDDILPEACPNL